MYSILVVDNIVEPLDCPTGERVIITLKLKIPS